MPCQKRSSPVCRLQSFAPGPVIACRCDPGVATPLLRMAERSWDEQRRWSKENAGRVNRPAQQQKFSYAVASAGWSAFAAANGANRKLTRDPSNASPRRRAASTQRDRNASRQ